MQLFGTEFETQNVKKSRALATTQFAQFGRNDGSKINDEKRNKFQPQHSCLQVLQEQLLKGSYYSAFTVFNSQVHRQIATSIFCWVHNGKNKLASTWSKKYLLIFRFHFKSASYNAKGTILLYKIENVQAYFPLFCYHGSVGALTSKVHTHVGNSNIFFGYCQHLTYDHTVIFGNVNLFWKLVKF